MTHDLPATLPRSLPPCSLIGAPTDIGAGARGASMGPEALRVAGLQAALELHGLQVLDRGNLSGPSNPWQPPVDGYRHLPEVVQWNRLVYGAVYAELQQGHLPILLGGDHSLGLGSISAVARHCAESGKKLRVLWLDAHADFNTSALTPSGNVHGMPVACLCGFGPAELTQLAAMPGGGPALHPSQIRQIGIRSVDAGEKRFVHEQGLEVFDMRFIDEVGMRQTMQQALAGLGHADAPEINISGLLAYDRSAFSQLTLDIQNPTESAALESFALHLGDDGSSLVYQGAAGKVDLRLDAAPPLQTGSEQQRQAAIAQQLQLIDAAARRGHADEKLVALFKNSFSQLHGAAPTTAGDNPLGQASAVNTGLSEKVQPPAQRPGGL